MYSNFKEQAIEYVRQAVQEDNAGNYAKAFPLYMNALEYFKTHLKYEKNPKIKDAITQKFTEYLRRAEEIRAVLDEGGPGPAVNGDAAVATKPKTKPKDGEGGDGEDPEQTKMRAGLNSAIIREKPNVKWNDVAGLESAKQALQEAVILPVKFPQFFTGKRRPWRAFLLYGPPGTGKSYLAKAVATEADSTFFSISSSDLVSKWMGESEKLVSNLFQMARESAPSIIFIDEIDSLAGQRGEGNESEASRRIKTELLVQMQGVGNDDQKVLILAATNTPYALDQAVRRRFDKRIYIPLPDLKARQHMFKVHLGDTPHNLTENDFENLARRTVGFSGSDISVCVKDVLFEPVRKTQDAMFFIKTSDNMWMPCGPKQPGAIQTTMQDLAAKGLASKILPPPISRTDFDKVLARQRPTVSQADLEVHERFTKEFAEILRLTFSPPFLPSQPSYPRLFRCLTYRGVTGLPVAAAASSLSLALTAFPFPSLPFPSDLPSLRRRRFFLPPLRFRVLLPRWFFHCPCPCLLLLLPSSLSSHRRLLFSVSAALVVTFPSHFFPFSFFLLLFRFSLFLFNLIPSPPLQQLIFDLWCPTTCSDDVLLLENEDDDWELCYDDGFVYKRRKKQHHESSAVAADSSNSESEAQQRRDRKKKILVGLREQYGREIQQWERLMAALHHLENNTQADSSLLPLTAFDKYTPQQIREGEGGCQLLIIDEILQKAEAQEAILQELLNLCDLAETSCKVQEEHLNQSLIDLPIWASPQTLMASLSEVEDGEDGENGCGNSNNS